MSNKAAHNDDQVIVTEKRIACDGGGGALGHPKVWMDMGQATAVTCKYCDRKFILDETASGVGGH